MLILTHGYLFVILLWSLCVDSLLFYKFWHGDEYNCSNTCLYALWSTIILILMHSISFFSRFVFDEFIANRVVERRNIINNYLRGRACIESVRRSWFQGEYWFWAFVLTLSFSYSSEIFLTLSCHFAYLCHFSCLLLVFVIFLLLDDLLELFLVFWVF
jgi:hypothetical protein